MMPSPLKSTGIIIMAAGASSRLGRPKQLEIVKGKMLLQHILDEVNKLENVSAVLILGANGETIKNNVDAAGIPYLIHQAWKDGMSSSMKAGLRYLLSNEPNFDQVILLVCDQPFVNADLLTKLIEQKAASEKGIICCAYADTLGVPVLFDQKYFDALLALNSREGAKKLILQNMEDVFTVSFPKGEIDMDTEADLEGLS